MILSKSSVDRGMFHGQIFQVCYNYYYYFYFYFYFNMFFFPGLLEMHI